MNTRSSSVISIAAFLLLNSGSSVTANTQPSLPASCFASQLSLGLDQEGRYFDSMSHSGTLLVLRNLGPQTCSVAAQPTPAFQDAQHHPLHVSLQTPAGIPPGPVILPVAIPVEPKSPAKCAGSGAMSTMDIAVSPLPSSRFPWGPILCPFRSTELYAGRQGRRPLTP